MDSTVMSNTRHNPMLYNLNIAIIFVCLFNIPASAQVAHKAFPEWYDTYQLTDRKGHVGALFSPRCDASAEKILDQWRGSLVFKYSQGAVSVNDEPWILDLDHQCPKVIAHRPPDPSIKGRVDISFYLDDRGRGKKRGIAHLAYSEGDPACLTAIVFVSKWIEP